MAQCVGYFRKLRPRAKIILMGHSTGCQDVMTYLTSDESRAAHWPAVDGAILRAPVSDREAAQMMFPPGMYDESVAEAKRMVAAQQADEMLPMRFTASFFGAPCTARRWLSLASPDHDGDDDLFSSDLSDAQLQTTFGRISAQAPPLCILYCGNDEFVPPSVDKPALLARWCCFVTRAGGSPTPDISTIIPGATHAATTDPPDVTDELVARVVRFVERCQSSSSASPSSSLDAPTTTTKAQD